MVKSDSRYKIIVIIYMQYQVHNLTTNEVIITHNISRVV